jgi:predicted alpha/beta hydrolase family esterase
MKKIQVLVIHGGTTFKSEKDYLRYLSTRRVTAEKKIRWSGAYLEKNLGKKFTVITPRMPLQDNAKYRDWKICFERYLPLLKKNFILMGSSLGGIFLAQYLSEHKLPRKALAVYLVCPPFDGSLSEEDLVGGFKLKSDLSLIEKNCEHLHLLFSKDDDVVPVAHAEKYRKKLKSAHIVIYKSKNGHFAVSKFPEIIKMIKADARAL